MSDAKDPRLVAAIDLIGRSGAESFEMRYSDDNEPVAWIALARWGEQHECAAAMSPMRAALRLLETVLDGGGCAHCGKPSGVWEHWDTTPPLHTHVCWQVYDPETEKFRRSCEGETTGRQFTMAEGKLVGRNDPCPCGSGKKFKHCHGA